MLKLYYARPSAFARPVWLAMLEKQLEFELIPVNLGGEQFEPAFQTLNPFGRIPVLLDGDLRVIESRAILDYLEAKYPQRSLLPQDPARLAKVRMVQSVALADLLPGMIRLLGAEADSPEDQTARQQITQALDFLEAELGEGDRFYAGEQLTVAELVAGNFVPMLSQIGVSLAAYPKLAAWAERLAARPSWRAIALSEQEWVEFKRRMRVLPKLWARRRGKKSVL